MARSHWLLVGNPAVWDVFGWWESGDRDFEGWTISRHFADVIPGDDVALWISGAEAGVYAIGRVTGSPTDYVPPVDDRFWKQPPDPAKTRYVPAEMDRYFFDKPIRKAALVADPGFRKSLVLRMPHSGNPFPVTDSEWQALRRHVPRQRTPVPGEPIVSERLLSAAAKETAEHVTAPDPGTATLRTMRELRLVRAYERHLGRPLVIHTITLPSGERLVTDGYDARTNLLIEAKASADRTSVRMAIGQLLDYSRFIRPAPQLAVLLPERPTDDLLALLASHGIAVVHQHNAAFKTL